MDSEGTTAEGCASVRKEKTKGPLKGERGVKDAA